MLSWISANLGTILISGLLLAITGGILIVMRREKLKGKSCLCDYCAGCPVKSSCHHR